AANSAEYDELYAYDGLQRLSDMQRGTLNSTKTALTSETFAQCWTLDATGNWTQFRQDDDGNGVWNLEQMRTANPVNEISGIAATTGPAWITPEYDPAGNMTTIPQPADPTSSYSAVYDAWNRLVRLTDDGSVSSSSSSSSSGEPTLVAEYEYDARGFRIRSTEGSEATRDVYYTETWQALEERVPPQTFPWAERQYIWGVRYIDDLVLRDRFSLSSSVDTLYALQDANWNVVAITDDSFAGAVIERYAYTSYGEPVFLNPDYTFRSSSSVGWCHLFTGLRASAVTHVYDARNRTYHGLLGTWLMRDPLALAAFLYEPLLDPPGWLSEFLSVYAAHFVPHFADPFGLLGMPGGVGHHYFPQALLWKLVTGGRVSRGAVNLSQGTSTGNLGPGHPNVWGGKGCPHDMYNQAVERQFEDYMKKHGLKRMNQAHMDRFIQDHLIKGDPVTTSKASAADGRNIARFNSTADSYRTTDAFDHTKASARDRARRGAKYSPPSEWQKHGMSALSGAALAEILAGVGALGTASGSPHLRNAMQALQDGDVVKAERELGIHDTPGAHGMSFCGDLDREGLWRS
ncbi:MAG: hypothetical protein ACK5Q5_06070, partial [Planctomycetaceae bacterium]